MVNQTDNIRATRGPIIGNAAGGVCLLAAALYPVSRTRQMFAI